MAKLDHSKINKRKSPSSSIADEPFYDKNNMDRAARWLKYNDDKNSKKPLPKKKARKRDVNRLS